MQSCTVISKPCAHQIPVVASLIIYASSRVRCLNIAKVQIRLCIAFDLKVLWYGSMEWNMEENFGMEWKIFNMERKWNGRKLAVWSTEKSSSIPYHALVTSSWGLFCVIAPGQHSSSGKNVAAWRAIGTT